MVKENGQTKIFKPPKIRKKLPTLQNFDNPSDSSILMRPERINSLEFVESFLTNQLSLPSHPISHKFCHDDLHFHEILGRGSYGTVHKTIHKDTNHEMAVKEIMIAADNSDDRVNKSLENFKKEIDTLKTNDCAQIVKFFGITFHERRAFICMELMDLSLDKLYQITHLIAKQIFHEGTLTAIAAATIHALEYLKNNKIIHRDIKPSNILLNKNGCVKLCDFGICGYLQNSVAQSVDAGCRPYMAPERLCLNSSGYDIKSDVWSLGISMIEVINGHFPYSEFSRRPVLEQVTMVVFGDPPLLKKDLEISMELKIFISKCIVKQPEMRADLQTLKELDFYKNHGLPENDLKVGVFVSRMYDLRHQLIPTDILKH